ncbi:hypothetical protein V7S43_010093 [Phytophthora oleae]|uniref:Uncharacterized protein n=1 Tax=Phytophthora oleae TaxID=2107226 RepID=A0ABD3FGW3_9STRA
MRKKSKIADANQRRAADIERHTADQRFLHPISQQDQDKCLHLLQEALGPQGLDECPCMVCDRLVLRRDSVRKEASDWKYVDKL